MIYLSMALYAEAAPFIKALHLKKQETHTRFQLFVSDSHRLIITGSGSLNAAIGDTWMLSLFSPSPDRDVFAQIGTCCGTAPAGSLYLCHKLTDSATGHSRYPDMLYRSSFDEASLITYQTIQNEPPSDGCLADMEGFAGFEAASIYFPPHRIMTWKIISDQGISSNPSDRLTPSELSSYIAPHVSDVISWLENLPSCSRSDSDTTGFLYTTLVERYRYSVTQQTKLRQLLHYSTLSGYDVAAFIHDLPDPTTIHPAQHKLEGKRILHELEQRILS